MTQELRLLTDFAQRNYRLFHDIYVLLDGGDRRVLEPFQLTPAQFRILTLLAAEPEWRLIDLSEAMLCARSTITRLVDGLERAGLVRRVDHPDDRRAQRLALTPAGSELFASAQTAHTHSLEQRLGVADPAAQEALLLLLRSLRAHLLADLGIENPHDEPY